jgi:hypothetical protein
MIFCFTLSSYTIAQEWSAQQKEVWSSVQDYWAISSNGSAAPHNKTDREKYIRHYMPKTTTALYTITPESIWVKGNFAFVHYSYTQVEVDMEGKERSSAGRWTDILTKDGNRWVMVGDSGGETSRDD